MTPAQPDKPKSLLDRAKELTRQKKVLDKKNALDELYPIMEQYQESESEREKRIMADPSAWTKLS
jgi:hypothetical protein